MPRLLTLVLTLWMACSLWSRGAAQSPEPPEYRELVEQALAEYAAKNYDEASTLFERAHGLFPNARTLRGMGMAAFELRQYDQSVRHLEAALAADVRPLEGALRQETEALAARARAFVATIELSVSPSHANLSLDGAPIAPGGGALIVALGPHVVEGSADGYAKARRELRVRGGEVVRVELALERTRHLQASSERRPLVRNPWLWTGVGAVVAGALVAGLVIGLRKEAETSIVPIATTNAVPGVALSNLEVH